MVMGTVFRLKDKRRKKPWRAVVSHRGYPVQRRQFSYEADARKWVQAEERHYDLQGVPLTNRELERTTLGDIVERFIFERTAMRRGKISDIARLRAFLKRDVCKR